MKKISVEIIQKQWVIRNYMYYFKVLVMIQWIDLKHTPALIGTDVFPPRLITLPLGDCNMLTPLRPGSPPISNEEEVNVKK